MNLLSFEIVAVVLIASLVAAELVDAIPSLRHRRWTIVLYVLIVPLLSLFAYIVFLEVAPLVSSG